jgi:hypothetical protein
LPEIPLVPDEEGLVVLLPVLLLLFSEPLLELEPLPDVPEVPLPVPPEEEGLLPELLLFNDPLPVVELLPEVELLIVELLLLPDGLLLLPDGLLWMLPLAPEGLVCSDPLPLTPPAGVWIDPELLLPLVLEGVVLVAPLPLTAPEPLTVSLPVALWLRLWVLQPASKAASAITRHAFFIFTLSLVIFPCP